MNVVAIIQVRSASTRLPGKCMLKIFGKTILEHIILRVSGAKKVQKICVATTQNQEDDIIERIVRKYNVAVYRGSESDVLDRFYQAAKLLQADIICRITADDPFKDPLILDNFIDDFIAGGYDYLSNTIEPTYPEGIDIEVFNFCSLEKAWEEASLPSEREHVTPYIWKNSRKFNLYNKKHAPDLSHLRWTLDKPEDWVFIQQVYDYLYSPERIFHMADILDLLKKHPDLLKINNKIIRNEGYLKSIKDDLCIERK